MVIKFHLKKKAIENGIADLKKSLEGIDIKYIKKDLSLIQVSMKLGEAVYKSTKPDDKDKGAGGDQKMLNLVKKIML